LNCQPFQGLKQQQAIITDKTQFVKAAGLKRLKFGLNKAKTRPANAGRV
jgi:hypothetical protein